MEKTINQQLDELFRRLEVTYKEDEKTFDSFNVFEAFHIQRSELAWSAWIAYLLNPQRNHGCGDKFLRSFLKQVNLPEDYVKAAWGRIVEREIGQIDKKYESGGRIDIIVHDPDANKAVIIENKIDADDQKKQLYRYYRAAKKWKFNDNDFRIFYLTPLKSKPSKDSIKGEDKSIGRGGELQMGKDFFCISYIDDIKNWLQACMAECDKSKPVKRIIEQSIKEIDYMCRQTVVDENFRKEVEEVLNANGITSIEQRLEVLNKIEIETYPKCTEGISSLKKIYQRDLFAELIHNKFPSAVISQEGKLDGYWCCKAANINDEIKQIYVMHDWPQGMYCGVTFKDCISKDWDEQLKKNCNMQPDKNYKNCMLYCTDLNNYKDIYDCLKNVLKVIKEFPSAFIL